MAKAKTKGNARLDAEPGGLWHQPALMNLLADLLIVLSIAALAWAALTALQRTYGLQFREERFPAIDALHPSDWPQKHSSPIPPATRCPGPAGNGSRCRTGCGATASC